MTNPFRTAGKPGPEPKSNLPRVVSSTALSRLVRTSYDTFVLEVFKETTHTDLLGNTSTFCRWESDITYSRAVDEKNRGYTISTGYERQERDAILMKTWAVFDDLDQRLNGPVAP